VVGPTGGLEENLRVSYLYDPILEGTTRELGVSTDLIDFDFVPSNWGLAQEEGLPTGKRRATHNSTSPWAQSHGR
jgi:hypothetical protein